MVANSPLFTQSPQYKVDKKIKIQVMRLTARSIKVVWSDIPRNYFLDSSTESGKGVAYLEVCDSPTGDYTVVEELTYDHPPIYTDTNSILNFFRAPVVYYRIRFPGPRVVTLPYSSEKVPNYYAAEIMRRHSIALKEGHMGNLFYLFIRRRTKERCPDCYDELRSQRTMVNCPTCMNTGYIGGYYNPISIYCNIAPEAENIEQPIDGTASAATLQGWTLGIPRINIGDIMIDAGTRELWNVRQVNLTTHKRVPTKQEFVIQYQEDDFSAYNLMSRIPDTIKKEDKRHGDDTY